MRELKEIAIALARITLGMVVLIEGIITIIFIDHISSVGSIYNDKIAAAYMDSYDAGHAQTYDIGYREVYSEAYDKGYAKGYNIGLGTGSKEGVAKMIEISNPTHKKMREFLARDNTDANPFVTGEYVCSDFAAEVNHNAEASGIRVAYVRIRSEKWGHAVVAFETVDKGLIFIEPQSDRAVKLVIGEPFPWYSVGAVSPLSSRDPLVEIQIIW